MLGLLSEDEYYNTLKEIKTLKEAVVYQEKIERLLQEISDKLSILIEQTNPNGMKIQY